MINLHQSMPSLTRLRLIEQETFKSNNRQLATSKLILFAQQFLLFVVVLVLRKKGSKTKKRLKEERERERERERVAKRLTLNSPVSVFVATSRSTLESAHIMSFNLIFNGSELIVDNDHSPLDCK